LMCPAVEIRDWPGFESNTVRDDVSRESTPELLKKQFRVPGA